MKLYTTTDASRPSSIFLTTSYTQPYTYWYVLTASSSLGAHQKKGRHQMEEVCQMSISGAFDHSRTSKKTEERKKKGKIFTQNVTLFWRTRASERVHIYTEVDKMSGNTDVEKGNFAVKAGLAQVRDSHPRELARFSSVDGFSFLLRRRRHRLSPFSWRLSSSSVLHFFSSHDDSYKSSQQREFKRKKSVDDDR